MVDPEDFRHVIRTGTRAGNSMVVVHCRTDEERSTSLVGFVVAKKEILRATKRNRVRRQLRHLMAQRITQLPTGTQIVIRVSRQAAGNDYDTLGAALDNALNRALAKWTQKGAHA